MATYIKISEHLPKLHVQFIDKKLATKSVKFWTYMILHDFFGNERLACHNDMISYPIGVKENINISHI